jgi:hypothetical protein
MGAMLTVSAIRPAADSSFRPLPPIMIGGPGCCTGRG